MTNHDELRKLAEEATPGPWITYQGTIASAELVKRYTEARMSMFPALARAGLSSDQRFIAAANPTQVIAILNEIRANEAEIVQLRKDIREWVCEGCSTVYPGPPQQGFKCVICPACNGNAMSRQTYDRRKMQAEIAQLRAELGATSRKLSEVKADLDERDGKLREVMAELEQAKKDAARYRRIRGHAGFNLNNDFDIGKFEVSQKTANGEAYHWYEEALDRAIDESMQTEEKKS